MHSGALRHGRWFKADPELGTTTGVLTLPATVSLLWIQAFIECYSQAQSLQLPALLSNLETQAMNFAVKEWYHRIFALPPRDLPTHASRRGYHCPHHRLPLRLHRNPSVWPQAPSPLRMSRPSSFYFSPQREKFLSLYACPSFFRSPLPLSLLPSPVLPPALHEIMASYLVSRRGPPA